MTTASGGYLSRLTDRENLYALSFNVPNREKGEI